MWLYIGPKDSTHIYVADYSDKELLDEVRRLTHFSQEDTIPLDSLVDPYDTRHLLADARHLPHSINFVLDACFFNFEFLLTW
jgi:hypothetical protein